MPACKISQVLLKSRLWGFVRVALVFPAGGMSVSWRSNNTVTFLPSMTEPSGFGSLCTWEGRLAYFELLGVTYRIILFLDCWFCPWSYWQFINSTIIDNLWSEQAAEWTPDANRTITNRLLHGRSVYWDWVSRFINLSNVVLPTKTSWTAQNSFVPDRKLSAGYRTSYAGETVLFPVSYSAVTLPDDYTVAQFVSSCSPENRPCSTSFPWPLYLLSIQWRVDPISQPDQHSP